MKNPLLNAPRMTSLPLRVAARFIAAMSKRKEEDAEARLEERMGEMSDALRDAQDLFELLQGDTNDELERETKRAGAVADALANCESVEKESDFDLSMKEAVTETTALIELLKKAKARLKKEPDLTESYEIAEGALEDAKGLLRELNSLEPEGGWAV